MTATRRENPLTKNRNRTDVETLCSLRRDALYARAETFYRRAGGTEPNVAAIGYGGSRAVLKDYGATPGWFGRWLGPLLIRREVQALERLAGLSGIPVLYARVDARAVLMERVPGRPWPQMRPSPVAFQRLEALVAAMHERGVAHCDLRSPSNILVDDEDRPYLVDFVARVRRGAAWNLPWNWLFAQFCRADRNALAKLKLRYAPELATADERERARHRGWLDRLARRLGAGVRALTRLFVKRGKT